MPDVCGERDSLEDVLLSTPKALFFSASSASAGFGRKGFHPKRVRTHLLVGLASRQTRAFLRVGGSGSKPRVRLIRGGVRVVTSRAQPADTFRQLLEEIHPFVRERRSASSFQMKKWSFEADKLMRVNSGAALEVKAQLAALSRNEDEVDRLYESAINTSDDYVGTFIRYLTVLSDSLRPEKLLEIYKALGSCVKGNIEAVRFVESLLASEGFMLSTWELTDELKKMNAFSSAGKASVAEMKSQFITTDGFSDVEFGRPVAFAKKFLADKNVLAQAFSAAPTCFEDGRSALFFQIDVSVSPEVAAELEWQLHGELEQRAFPAEVAGKVVIALVGTHAELT